MNTFNLDLLPEGPTAVRVWNETTGYVGIVLLDKIKNAVAFEPARWWTYEDVEFYFNRWEWLDY